jgi:multidrug resistance protein
MKKQVGLFFAVMFVIGTDTFLLSPLLPTLQTEFAVRTEISGWMVGAYALGYALFALISGPLSDQRNRKKIMVVGMAAFTVTTLLCAFAQGFWTMCIFRFLAGVSAAFVAPQVWAMIPSLVEPKEIIRAFGFTTAGLSIAQLLGVPMGSYLAAFNWPLPFFTVGLLSFFLTIFIQRWIPQPVTQLSSQTMSILERYRTLLTRPKASLAFVAYFFFHLANFSSFTFIGIFLTNNYELSISEVGTSMILFGFGNLLGSLSSGWMTKKWGTANTFFLLMLVLIAVYLGIGHFISFSLVSFSFFTIFLAGGAIFPILMGSLQSISPDARGTIASLANSMMYGAAALGSYLSGILFVNFHGFLAVSLFSAVNFAISFIVFLCGGFFSLRILTTTFTSSIIKFKAK